jgi:hypothetical protein
MTEIDDANQKFRALHKLTQEQDILQLSIPHPSESLAIGLDIINHANALILEVSKYYGDIQPIARHGYLTEHFEYLCRGVNGMIQDYNITTPDDTLPKYNCQPLRDEVRKPYSGMTPEEVAEIMPQQIETIYRGIRFNGEELEFKE